MRKIKKLIGAVVGIFTFSILCVVFGMYAQISNSTNVEPEIKIIADISQISKEEYEKVGVKGIDNPTRDDFKKFTFELNMRHSGSIGQRKIIMPRISECINLYDHSHRYWYGQSGSQDNVGENFAHYDESFVFYSRGLDENTLRNIYHSKEINISWVGRDGREQARTYNIGDMLLFQ